MFDETASGATTDRPGLAEAIVDLLGRDTIVSWRLDHLGRSLGYLIGPVGEQHKGICFRSLTEQIDKTAPSAKLIVHVFGPLAEFERDLMRERINAGFAGAWA